MTNTTVENVRDELRAVDAVSDAADVLSDSQIQTIGIEPAHLEVSEDVAPATDYSADRLELIERYLAVHEILTSGIDEIRQLSSEGMSDGTNYSYADAESYREKAKRLDREGVLDGLEQPNAAFSGPDTRGSRTR